MSNETCYLGAPAHRIPAVKREDLTREGSFLGADRLTDPFGPFWPKGLIYLLSERWAALRREPIGTRPRLDEKPFEVFGRMLAT